MKNLYIYLFVFIIMLMGVSATDICLDTTTLPNITCYMVTPTLFCENYTYDTYNDVGMSIDSGTLAVFDQTINSYYFNFTEDVGTYYIKICDGSTRQIIVEGDKMIGLTAQTWIFIILILLFILFMILGFTLHPIFLMLNGFIFGYFAFYTFTTLQNVFVLIMMSLVSIAFIFIGLLIPMSDK